MNNAIAFIDTGLSLQLRSLLPEELPPYGYDIWENETCCFAVECTRPSRHYGTLQTLELMEAPGVPERYQPFREEATCVGRYSNGFSVEGKVPTRPLAVYRYC